MAPPGDTVRPVARRYGVSLDDTAGLAQAFAGAWDACLIKPFDLSAKDLHARERELCRNLPKQFAAQDLASSS